MRLYKKLYTENCYQASSWNFEIAKKYIFEVDSLFLEASFFVHYLDGVFVKKVIELPSSFGCPMKCGFCASSHISKVTPLSANVIEEIYEYVLSEEGVATNESLVVSFTGMGDLFFTISSVEEVIKSIARYNENAQFTVSSCCWTTGLVERIERLSTEVKFRAIQCSFVSCSSRVVQRVIPFYGNDLFIADNCANLIETSSLNGFRINYIMVNNLNDSDNAFDEFIRIFRRVRANIVVRISKMNETAASKRNGLLPPDISRMMDFNRRLTENGFSSYLFYSAQNDNMNCGQLVTECMVE